MIPEVQRDYERKREEFGKAMIVGFHGEEQEKQFQIVSRRTVRKAASAESSLQWVERPLQLRTCAQSDV